VPIWPFRKRKPPSGLTLNGNFYLTVLAPGRDLPPLLSLINPDGSNGAVAGFGAPLSEGASRDLLNVPMPTGAYALTTRAQDTVVQMDIFTLKQVPNFVIPKTPGDREAAGITSEVAARLDLAQYLINFVIRGYRDALESVRFFLDVVARMGTISDGAVADALAEAYRLPGDLALTTRLHPLVDFREIGTVRLAPDGEGAFWVSSRGLVKFNLPEFEMYGVPREYSDAAARMIAAAAQQSLIGMPMRPGESAFSPNSPLLIHQGTRNRNLWGDRPTLEFRDPGGTGAAKGVRAWEESGN
jgi:hypothetical protein